MISEKDLCLYLTAAHHQPQAPRQGDLLSFHFSSFLSSLVSISQKTFACHSICTSVSIQALASHQWDSSTVSIWTLLQALSMASANTDGAPPGTLTKSLGGGNVEKWACAFSITGGGGREGLSIKN